MKVPKLENIPRANNYLDRRKNALVAFSEIFYEALMTKYLSNMRRVVRIKEELIGYTKEVFKKQDCVDEELEKRVYGDVQFDEYSMIVERAIYTLFDLRKIWLDKEKSDKLLERFTPEILSYYCF